MNKSDKKVIILPTTALKVNPPATLKILPFDDGSKKKISKEP
jgi:hypothetical protein